jgi:hypothetical protein
MGMVVIHILLAFSSLSFLLYGISCLTSSHMTKEFVRFGLERHRKLTGWLEIAGAAGLATGIINPLIGLMASTGLCLLMLAGYGVRLRIGDGFIKSSPAFIYMVLNAALGMFFLRLLGWL